MKKFGQQHPAIITSFIQGDQEAFRFVFNFFYKKLYGFVYKITKSDYSTQEIIQEVFIKLWSIRASIEMSESFDAFVYTITRNLTYNFLRDASKKESLKKELWEAIKMEQYHTENIFQSKEYEEIIDDIVSHLPKKKRIIYVLSRQQGKSNQEIADLLGISKKTVKNHLWKTLQLIKIQLEPHLQTLILVYLLSQLF